MQGWLLLVGTIIFEILGTTSMKLSDGFKNPIPSVLLFVFYGLSFGIFTIVLKHIDVSIAYAIWSGVGTAAISVIGFVAFGEQMNTAKVFFIGLIVVGVIGLNLAGNSHT